MLDRLRGVAPEQARTWETRLAYAKAAYAAKSAKHDDLAREAALAELRAQIDAARNEGRVTAAEALERRLQGVQSGELQIGW